MPISDAADGRRMMVTIADTIGRESFLFCSPDAEDPCGSPALFRGEQAHNRRLYDRDQRHVGISADRDSPRSSGAIFSATKMAVGPSAPPMIPMAAAC